MNCGSKTFTVSFFGHRIIENADLAEKNLEAIIKQIIEKEKYTEFLVGRNGEFDLLVASVIKRVKHTIPEDNSVLVWVMPYPTAEFRKNATDYEKYYDEIEICTEAEKGYFRSAFQIRNQKMIERSNLIVCYIEHKSGGAYNSFQYALKCKKAAVNLYNDLPPYIIK